MKIRLSHIWLVVWALLPALFSCTRRELPVEGYEYRLALAEDGTKALLNENGVFWQNGDQVGLFLGNGSSVAGSVDVTTSPKTIVFSTSQALADGIQIYAYYPYVAGNTDASAARILFPDTQSGGTASAMPLAGIPFQIKGNGRAGVVHFANLGGVIDFRIYSSSYAGEEVQSVSFGVSSGTHSVSGEAQLNLTQVRAGNDASLDPDWSASAPSSITLTQSATVAASKQAPSGHMYMVVPPGTYSGTITVRTDAATYTLPFENLVFYRNEIRPAYVNLEGENVSRDAVYSLENDKVAQYLNDVDRSPYSASNYSVTHMKQAYYGGNTNTANRLDWPKPVPVRWTNPASGNASKVVSVYNNAARTDMECSVNVSDASATRADVYNLIPGRTYYYTVTSGGSEIARGSFRTTGRRRMMKVGDSPYGRGYANNCRDFGGQKTADGHTIKYGKMFRGSNMDLTTAEQKDYLLHVMNLGLDVDLRSYNAEYGPAGSGGGILYDALGLDEMHTTQVYNSWGELTNVESMKATLTQVFDAVAAGKVPYIHCMVGADRTGYVCMLLEALLGVPQGWCDVDYELTSFSGAADDGTPRLRSGGENYYYFSVSNWWGQKEIRGVDFINTFSGSTFQEKAIDYVVNTLGISRETISAFQNNMLE